MKRLVNFIAIFSASVFITGAAFAQAANSTGFKILKWKTKNNVEVYFVKRPEIPMVDVAVVFAAGSSYDGVNAGLASFTSMMLNEGTKTKSATEIAKAFDAVGAKFAASANRDMTVIGVRAVVHTDYLDPAMSTFLDVLTHPSFPLKSFSRVKQQILDGIKQNLQDPNQVASNAFFKSLYGTQPYGHPVSGSLDSVNKITRDEISQFYKKYYVAQNAKIVLVGDLSQKQAHYMAEAITTRLASGSKAPEIKMTSQVNSDKRVFVPMPITQNTIIIGENGITRQNKDYYNLLVANHVLGGLPMTSLLFDQVRNRHGLVYGIYSGFQPLSAKGPFIIWLQTRSAKTTQAVDLVNKILKTYLHNGPNADQLRAAKLNIEGGFPLKISTNSGIIANVINIAFYHLPLDFLNTYSDHIKKVTIESAKSAFANHIEFNKLNTIIVGINNHNDVKKQSS